MSEQRGIEGQGHSDGPGGGPVRCMGITVHPRPPAGMPAMPDALQIPALLHAALMVASMMFTWQVYLLGKR